MSAAVAKGQKPGQGHLCEAAGRGGLWVPTPSPWGGGRRLSHLGIQAQSLHPTLWGPDRSLSDGTELSRGAGLTRRKKGHYWSRNAALPPCQQGIWTHPAGLRDSRWDREAFLHPVSSRTTRPHRLRLGGGCLYFLLMTPLNESA